MTIVRPPRLKAGDLIGLVAPASTPASRERVQLGVRYLERLGYRVVVGKSAFETYGYLAGTDEQRADDLNAMFRSKEVKAIIAIRGGYGTPRLLGKIDYTAIRRNPKIIVGYSDLTALQLAIFRKTRLVTFSGPMLAVEMGNAIDPYTEEHFWRMITSTKKIGVLQNPQDEPVAILREGTGGGILLGGNFALVMSLMGTPYMPSLRNSTLILEDVDEAPHRIDRMFAQLMHAGILKNISALLLGKFTDCNPADPQKPFLTPNQIFREVAERVKVPVVANIQYGHIEKKLTIPFGLNARIDTKKKRIEVLEAGVE